jgi:integrase/recombinase XerC
MSSKNILSNPREPVMDERHQTLQKFEKYLKRRAPGSRTSIDYVSDVAQFATFCPKPWREIKLGDIDAFVDHQRQKGRSAATLKRRVAALKVFFDFLIEDSGELSWPNPVRFKRHAGKQPKRLPRDLTDEQVAQLWAQISSVRDRAWFALMLRAGLRVGEVVALTLNDLLSPATLNQPARIRVCGKGQKERVVLLTADAAAVLQEWLQQRPASDAPQIFLNQRGQPLKANGLEWLLRHYGRMIDLKVNPHRLRHTFARQMLEGGMPLTSLGKLLGHAQISTTEIYTAGADPALVETYQTTMARLAQASLAEPEAQPYGPRSAVVNQASSSHSRPSALPPDWDQWAPNLPEALRQTSLAFVQRRWLLWKPQRRRAQALRTLGNLRRFWEWQLTYRAIDQPTELTLKDFHAYQSAQAEAGQAAATTNRTLSDLLPLLQQLADQGQAIDPSVFHFRFSAVPKSLPRYLPEAQIQCLEIYVRQRFDQADQQVRLENACFFILAHTGLRASECLDLQGQDLDLADRRLMIRQGKDRRDRVVFLSPLTLQALTHYLAQTRPAPQAPLLLQPNGRPLSYWGLLQGIVALGQAAAGIKVTPHQLRHTLATRLLNAGMNITQIQKILGHDHLSTTMIYAQVLDTTLEVDYQQAMRKIEGYQLPLSRTPELVSQWPTVQSIDLHSQSGPVQVTLDYIV